MYAVIEEGGKQFIVEKGTIIDIDLQNVDKKKISFSNVLLYNDGKKVEIGSPSVAKCSVTADVIGPVKGPKVIAFKYRKRKDSKKTIGHRQKYTRVKITGIKSAKETKKETQE